jgi:hypothetical protein
VRPSFRAAIGAVMTTALALVLGAAPIAQAQSPAPTTSPSASSIAVPTSEPQPSVPTFHQDPDLEALFPSTVGGQPLDVQSVAGQAITQFFGSSTPEELQLLNDFLSSAGKTIDDVSVGVGFFEGPPSGTIIAFRIKGVDTASQLPTLLNFFLSNMQGATQTPTAISGKSVTSVAVPGSPPEATQYYYPQGEVVWLVNTVDPALTEIFGALP